MWAPLWFRAYREPMDPTYAHCWPIGASNLWHVEIRSPRLYGGRIRLIETGCAWVSFCDAVIQCVLLHFGASAKLRWKHRCAKYRRYYKAKAATA